MKSAQKKTLLKEIGIEFSQRNNAVDSAINHLALAESIMFNELKGRNPIGMYSEFGSLIKLLKMYKNAEKILTI